MLFPTPSAGTAKNTVMGWETSDIETEVADLKSRGVVFEDYDLSWLKTINSIMYSPTNRAAWFKDSGGNTLGIIQMIYPNSV